MTQKRSSNSIIEVSPITSNDHQTELMKDLCMAEYRETSINYIHKFLNQYNAKENMGVSYLIKALERTIKMPVYIFDCSNNLVACGKEQEGFIITAFEQFEERYGKFNILKYSLGYCGDLYIVCKTETMPLAYETVILNSLLALIIGISDYQNIYEENLNRLICDILNRKINDNEISESKLVEFKLDTEAEYICIALNMKEKAIPDSNQENFLINNKLIGRLLNAEIKRCLKNDTIVVSDDATFIILWRIEGNEGITKNTANRIVEGILECGSKYFGNYTVTVGISSSHSPITKVNIPFNEAKQALELGSKIFGVGASTHYDDLSMYRILLEMDDISRINKSMNFIKKITEYDQNNNTELMNTLEVYYSSNFNLKETAYKLFLHYNSISYRLKKISEITNVDITSSDGMFTLIVGMKLKNYSK